ncbi:MAG: response regulator, partial [Clostridia bacterium]|nr:response regulator [Clostridia bacterium]
MSDSKTSNKPKILIVDDSQINRMMLSELLGDEYDILEAADGREAISVVSVNPDEIDLVVLDLVMPVMDGFKTLEVMKERGWLTSIPVIVVSADDDNVSMEKVYDMGAVDFFPRPYNSAVIHNRINNTLALYRKQKRLVGVVEE